MPQYQRFPSSGNFWWCLYGPCLTCHLRPKLAFCVLFSRVGQKQGQWKPPILENQMDIKNKHEMEHEMENKMENEMANEMETGVILGNYVLNSGSWD